MARWFEADKGGLAKLLREKGIWPAVIELVQNALDETTTRIEISLTKMGGRRQRYLLVVEDDSPEGFKFLFHAYTFFAESEKKGDPLKRGRFNWGEKRVLALCERAMIATTTGTVRFEEDGTRTNHPRITRPYGSVFTGEVIMTEQEFEQVVSKVQTILPPPKVEVTFNGEPILPREPITEFAVAVPTVKADDEGNLRATRRMTKIEVHDPREGEKAMIYEMGLPVVETGDRYHVNVLQKVPLNMDRDNVTPAYLRELRTHVLNHTYEEIDQEEATGGWVKSALEDKRVYPEAVQGTMDKLYGRNRVVQDPSDREANARAIERGYTVIPSRGLSRAAWHNVREHDRAGTPPAGVVFPTPKPFHPGGKPLKVLKEEEWSDEIRNVVAYAKWVAQELLGHRVRITVADDGDWGFNGTFGDNGLIINNASGLDMRVGDEMNRFLIHEFGHHYADSHLSEDYHNALCRLGAKFTRLAFDQPKMMKEFGYGWS